MIADPARTKEVLERSLRSGSGSRSTTSAPATRRSPTSRRLPVSEIKIDRSFVMNMHTSDDDATIVRSIIDLGGNLGLSVVAEGVENQEIWDDLEALGCPLAQGYHLCRPLPADALAEWLSGPQTRATAVGGRPARAA